jgi:hypothetical protein
VQVGSDLSGGLGGACSWGRLAISMLSEEIEEG